MSSTNEQTPHARPPKMVLICPACGHESPIAGDWRLETQQESDDEVMAYVCPDCSSVVTRRPNSLLLE